MNRSKLLISILVFLSIKHLQAKHDDFIKNKPQSEGSMTCSIFSDGVFQSNQLDEFNQLHAIPQSLISKPLSNAEYKQLYQSMIAHDIYCRQTYHMGQNETENMMHMGYDDFIDKLLSDQRFDDQIIKHLWNDYLDRYFCKRKSKVKQYSQKIEDELERRKLYRKLCDVEHYRQVQKLDELKYFKSVYQLQLDNDDPSEAEIIRTQSRQKALQKTKEESFVQYDRSYQLTPQAQAYLKLYGLDNGDHFQFHGTALQQELHKEVCDIFEQAAMLERQLPYRSQLLYSGTLFAHEAYLANKKENMQLVASLTNVSFGLLEITKSYRQAMANGVLSSVQDLAHMVVHPIQTIQSVGKALCYVFETVALNSYREEFGFQDIYAPLRDERNAQIIIGLKNLGHAISHSSGEQKVEALTRFGTDFFVPGKIMQAIGGLMGAVKSEIKFVQAYESFAVAAVGDQTAFSEISYEVAQMMQKSESLAQETIAQQTVGKLMECEKQIEKMAKLPASQRIKRIGDSRPKEIDIRSLLDKNLEILEEVSQEAARIEYLSDGRIRYYKSETAASTPGPTRGFAYVLEYDPSRGMIRGWYEGYTHAGKVNRVHPKMINGKDIVSLHYPHTKKELELIAQKVKVKK